MNKYINFFNDEFIYNEQKSLDNKDLYLTLPIENFDKHIFPMDSVIKIVRNKKIYNIAYFEIRSSGDFSNNNKRIQIQQKLFTKESLIKNNLIDSLVMIGIYNAGNKFCYVRFGKHPIINQSNSSKSVWVNFNQLVYCLRNEKKIKYQTTDKVLGINYWIFLSNKFDDLLEIDEKDFNEIKEIEIIKINLEINKFKLEQKILLSNHLKNVLTTEKLKTFVEKEDLDFSVLSNIDNLNQSDCKSHSENLNIGRKAEEIFNRKLESESLYISKELSINRINSIKWVNEFKESYKPYDFCINGYIFIDIKGTCGSKNYFEISNNEMNFRKKLKEEGNKYFIVNVTNVLNEFDSKLKFYNDEKIENLDFKEKIKFVYEGD